MLGAADARYYRDREFMSLGRYVGEVVSFVYPICNRCHNVTNVHKLCANMGHHHQYMSSRLVEKKDHKYLSIAWKLINYFWRSLSGVSGFRKWLYLTGKYVSSATK